MVPHVRPGLFWHIFIAHGRHCSWQQGNGKGGKTCQTHFMASAHSLRFIWGTYSKTAQGNDTVARLFDIAVIKVKMDMWLKTTGRGADRADYCTCKIEPCLMSVTPKEGISFKSTHCRVKLRRSSKLWVCGHQCSGRQLSESVPCILGRTGKHGQHANWRHVDQRGLREPRQRFSY